MVERYALVPDSGGARPPPRRLGVEQVVRARTDMMVNNRRPRPLPSLGPGRRRSTPPATRWQLRLGGRWKTDFPNAKVLVAQLKPGDAFKIRSGGGGGYGSPLERPVDEVENDVRQGYVTLAAALEFYGVVIDPETFEADPQATEKLRAAKRSTAAVRRRRAIVRSAPELDGIGHGPGPAARAAHGDQDVLLLLLVEIGAIEHPPRLLLEQLVQRRSLLRDFGCGCGSDCGPLPR